MKIIIRLNAGIYKDTIYQMESKNGAGCGLPAYNFDAAFRNLSSWEAFFAKDKGNKS